jgi:hypothetical protein
MIPAEIFHLLFLAFGLGVGHVITRALSDPHGGLPAVLANALRTLIASHETASGHSMLASLIQYIGQPNAPAYPIGNTQAHLPQTLAGQTRTVPTQGPGAPPPGP